MSQHSVARSTARTSVGWLPFACVLAAIALIATSAVTWVISPQWGRSNVTAAPRNVGTVPTLQGALASFVSPNMIEIPKLDTKAPIINVGTLPGGALNVPRNPRTVGWWSAGAKPGARVGTAILAGHINYSGVQGALGRINKLNPGDTVYVDGLRDGKKTRVKFSITGVRTYDKKALPYKEIFNQKSVGRLVLVTCGGPFDAHTGNYLDNIVAYAVPA